MHIQDDFVSANISSDKVPRHGYQRFYPYFLEPFRRKDGVKVLEIGFHLGNSVQLWKNYFINPRIFSIDIKDSVECEFLAGYYKMDQSDRSEIEKFVNNIEHRFDVIIDDGSHVPDHQWNTFIHLFKVLNEGGIYIIEDIETSFWGKSIVYGYPFDADKSSLIKKVECLSEIINSEFIEQSLKEKYSLSDLEYSVLMEIELCTIGHNCIIFVKKNHSKHQSYYRSYSDYPMKGNINRRKSNFFNRIVNNRMIKRIFH